MQERKDLELEKALVEVERTYQAKLQAQHDKYNEKVADMHAENERIRKNYESRLEAFNKEKNRGIRTRWIRGLWLVCYQTRVW